MLVNLGWDNYIGLQFYLYSLEVYIYSLLLASWNTNCFLMVLNLVQTLCKIMFHLFFGHQIIFSNSIRSSHFYRSRDTDLGTFDEKLINYISNQNTFLNCPIFYLVILTYLIPKDWRFCISWKAKTIGGSCVCKMRFWLYNYIDVNCVYGSG